MLPAGAARMHAIVMLLWDPIEALMAAGHPAWWLIGAVALCTSLCVIALILAGRIRMEKSRHRKTQEALRDSEQSRRLLVSDQAGLVRVYDMDRKLVFASPAVEKLTGYSMSDLQKEGFVFWVHPDDRSRMLSLWENLFCGRASQEEEYRLSAKEGRATWVSATWTPIFDDTGRQIGVQGNEREITARKYAEDALQESERRFRELLDSVHLVAVIVNLKGYICFCNDYTLAITGWSREEVMGHPASQFFAPECRPQLVETIEQAQRTGQLRTSTESAILTRNGGRRWIEWNSIVLRDAAGASVGFASLGADVTRQRKIQAASAEVPGIESVEELVRGVAHDCNNLLTVINGCADLVGERLAEGDPSREGVEEIRRAGQHAAQLIQQLFAVGRKQISGKEPLDLNRLILDSERMISRLVGDGIQVTMMLEHALRNVLVDASQMHRVLINLVMNARNAMPQGGSLVIQTVNVQSHADAAARRAGRYVQLKVIDTGVGMDEQTREHIFEPYFTTKPAGKGTGLGMSTVHGIVKQSDGWIWVSSEPGKGTSFEIYLPAD